MTGLLQSLALRLDAGFNAKHIEPFKRGWPSKSRSDVRFHETDRVMFRYREAQGPVDAPTIVFSADPPVTLEQYDELIELASKHFRVIVFELPANGFSPAKGSFRFGFQETNDEVAHFLRAIAGDAAIYAFSCAAGLAAVDIAARYPELVRAMVLIQVADVGGFAAWKSNRDPKQVLVKPIVGQLTMRKIARKRMPDWFGLVLGRKDDHQRFCSCADRAMDHGSLWSLASAYQVYLTPDIEIGMPSQPTLAIWGEADRSHTDQTRASSVNLATNIEVKTLRNLGHFPELEDPELVFPIIRDWIVQLPN